MICEHGHTKNSSWNLWGESPAKTSLGRIKYNEILYLHASKAKYRLRKFDATSTKVFFTHAFSLI